MPERIKRVNALIQRELGDVLHESLELPKGALLTITKVVTSKDLHYAKIWISVHPFEYASEVLHLLQEQKLHLQYEFHQRIRLRVSPKISFLLDETAQRVQKIDNLLSTL